MSDSNSRWWTLEIKPQKALFDFNFQEIWKYKDLIFLFVRRDFVALYKQTILGPLWFLIQPVLTSVMFYFVFGRVAKISTDGLPPFYFYMAGVTAWGYFSECLNKTANTFIENANIYGKVYFPRIVIPISTVLSNLIKFFIQFGLFLVIAVVYSLQGYAIEFQWDKLFWFPILVLLMAMFGLGLGVIVSSLTTKYRDLRFLMTFAVQLMMYGTPVIYPMSRIVDHYPQYKWIVLANPMSAIIESFRFIFSGNGIFSYQYLLISTAIIFVVLFVGLLLFGKVERNFMDTV
jgi:lipopolysaccharide transport system permease protein